MAPSNIGLVHRPLKAERWVRLPLELKALHKYHRKPAPTEAKRAVLPEVKDFCASLHTAKTQAFLTSI